MRLNLVAVAVLAPVALSAMAQSNVTAYGALDIGVLRMSNTGPGFYTPLAVNKGTVTKLADGGIGSSYWGLKGAEDLGGGLKANFQLQSNVKMTDGSGGGTNGSAGTSAFNQYATVGLSGPLGRVDLGRQISPIFFAFASTDARGGRYFGSALTAMTGLNGASGTFPGASSNASFGTIYNDNALVYQSPNLNGVVVGAEYAQGSGGGNANAHQALTLQYDAGNGLKLSALYYNGNGDGLNLTNPAALTTNPAAAFTPVSGTANTNRLYGAGALYGSGPLMVSLGFMLARNPANNAPSGPIVWGSNSLDMLTVGGGYRMSTQLNLTAGYYKIIDHTNAGNYSTQFAVGLEYYWSRRSMLYVEAASVSNVGSNMNTSPLSGMTVAAGRGSTACLLGMRHAF